VRRIFAALGSHVLGLCRVGFGRLALPPDLAPGAYRPITLDDV
jgi:16S rRNA pseudouridine516 synthase